MWNNIKSIFIEYYYHHIHYHMSKYFHLRFDWIMLDSLNTNLFMSHSRYCKYNCKQLGLLNRNCQSITDHYIPNYKDMCCLIIEFDLNHKLNNYLIECLSIHHMYNNMEKSFECNLMHLLNYCSLINKYIRNYLIL